MYPIPILSFFLYQPYMPLTYLLHQKSARPAQKPTAKKCGLLSSLAHYIGALMLNPWSICETAIMSACINKCMLHVNYGFGLFTNFLAQTALCSWMQNSLHYLRTCNRRDKGVGVGGGGTSQTTYISPQQKHDRGYSIITKYGST